MLRACQEGDTEAVLSLLENGADVNEVDPEGQSGLFLASEAGHVDVVELLLAFAPGASPTLARKADGWAPLHIAAFRGREAVIARLLDGGGDGGGGGGVDLRDLAGTPPLFLAARAGKTGAARLLLDRGADSRTKTTSRGWTALHIAAQNDHLRLLDLLLDRGADVDAETNFGWPPLFLAVQNENREAAELLLLRGASMDRVFSGGWSVVGTVARAMYTGMLKQIWDEALRACPVRVALLGAPAAGKTTLVQLLRQHRQRTGGAFPSGDLATDGIAVEAVGELVFWDFGGQEVLHATHQFFLTEETQYVVVVDLARLAAGAPEYLRDVDYWLGLAARWSAGPGAPPALLVGTHCDQLERREATAAARRLQEAARAAGLHDAELFEIWRPVDGASTSALPLKKLYARIVQHAQSKVQQRHGLTEKSRSQMRFAHIKLRQRVEEERARGVKFVWWSQFLDYCREYRIDVDNEEEVQRATAFLVNFGAVVTYRQVSTAAPSLVVLDPEWLSKAFTSIVSIKLIGSEQRRGFLRREALEARWRELGMAENSWPQLMNLFSLFQLLVRLPDGRLFVPSLLRTPKAGAAPMTPAEREAFFYLGSRRPEHVYGRKVRVRPALPAGLVDRMVVRLLHFPGLDIVEEATWTDDYVLSSPFGRLRLQGGLDNSSLSIQLFAEATPKGAAEADLAFFVHFLFDSPRALLSSYFLEASIESSTVFFDGAECGPESELLARALFPPHGADGDAVVAPAAVSPDLALLGVPRLDPASLVVEKKLNEGSFGIVSLASYEGAAVVVKQLKNIATSPRHQREFFHEVLMMRRFHDSPFLVRLLGVCPQPPPAAAILTMVLEFAPLGDLTACHELLRASTASKSAQRALKFKLAFDLARGLRDLHCSSSANARRPVAGGSALPLIHRDVRSQNFFIFSLDERAARLDSEVLHGKLGDFGTVVVASPNYGEELGNFQYMAPEAFRGALAVPYSQAIDVYSFGVLMWEIFHGEPPYREYIMNAGVGRSRILDGERPPIAAAVDPGAASVMRRCWDANPDKRPCFDAIVAKIAKMIPK